MLYGVVDRSSDGIMDDRAGPTTMSPYHIPDDSGFTPYAESWSISITRVVEGQSGKLSESILHEEVMLATDASEVSLCARWLMKAYGGDGFHVHRSAAPTCREDDCMN
jgi:hypothetical protein